MKIGFVLDQFGNLSRGGAEVQADKTLKYLNREEGISAEIIDYSTDDLSKYDIIHFFKSNGEYYFLERLIRDLNIPYVISTIYYPNSSVKIINLIYKILAKVPNKIRNQFYFGLRYSFWKNAEKLFPNTDEEAEIFYKLGFKEKTEIILNGIDKEDMVDIDEKPFVEKYEFLKNKKFVLNVGRIDRRKNQKMLVEACKKLDIYVVIIGKIADKKYYEEIKDINYSKVYFLGPIYDTKLLFSAYNACEVFCLPSTLETPGIAAIEAAYYNKKIVITEKGGTRYYFKDKAYYVKHNNINDIVKKIKEALENRNRDIKEIIKSFYWEEIAVEYKKVYKNIMLNRKNNI